MSSYLPQTLVSWALVLTSAPAFSQVAGFETCVPGHVLGPCAPESWVAPPSVWGGYPAVVEPFAPVVPGFGTPVGPSFGFPTQGNHWVILDAMFSSGGLNSPYGGPAPYPLVPGETAAILLESVVIQTPITFDFNYVTPEVLQESDSFNDFFTVDLVDPNTGLAIVNILYYDTWSSGYDSQYAQTPMSHGMVGYPAVSFVAEVAPVGQAKRMVFDVPPGLVGRTLNLEFHVANGFDHEFSSYAWRDNIHMGAPTFSGSWDYRNGTLGLNPDDFTCSTQPTSGYGWKSKVDMTPVFGFTSVASIVAVGSNGPTMGGLWANFELLTVGPFYLDWSMGEHSIPVPPGLTGLALSSQGVRMEQDAGGVPRLVLLNAVDMVIG